MSSRRRAIIFLFCVSLLVKLAGVVYMNRNLSWNLLAPDTRSVYRPLAVNLVEGHGYQLKGDYRNVTKIAPGFPVYLAAVYGVFGIDSPTWWLGVLNALLRAVTTVLVYLLAARAFDGRVALAAGFVHAVDPWEAFWAAFVLKESVAVFLSVLAIYLVIRMLDRPTWVRGGFAGVALAAASLTRYATLGLYACVLIAVAICAIRRLVTTKAAVRLAAAVTLGLLAGLSPWIARNNLLFGAPLIFTRAGFYFFVSNGPGAERTPDMWGYAGRSRVDMGVARTIVPRRSSYAVQELSLFTATLTHLVTHPRIAVTLVAYRFVNIWRPTFAGSSRMNKVALGLPYSVMMLAALYGLVIGLRPRHARTTIPGAANIGAPEDAARARLVLYAVTTFYVLLHAVFWSEIRYRQYVTPMLAVFAGYAISELWSRFRAPRSPSEPWSGFRRAPL